MIINESVVITKFPTDRPRRIVAGNGEFIVYILFYQLLFFTVIF